MTALDWYYEQTVIQGKTNYYELLEKAKEIEKQMVIDAANQNQFGDIDGMGISDTITKGEQYYNETYGSKGSETK